MNRAEILSGYLKVLDDITASTQVALETLQTNAETANMIIHELIYGATESPFEPNIDFQSLMPSSSESYIEDDIDTIADKIVKQIKADDMEYVPGAIRAIDIMIDPDKIDPQELMELVQKKLSDEDESEVKEPEEESSDESINFDNPLE